ncbi:MAG: type II CRISPR-associated endonuclease Cas1 [Candidatus Obscuribacterales bacterium]|nr:type II CRISPR-associated endonuclease Cas1 [Candidatus Obscuribacterales bacterium]
MSERIVLISSPAHLSLFKKQLKIRLTDTEEFHQIPIEDMGILLIDNQSVTLSQGLISSCLQSKVGVVVCNEKHIPAGFLQPLEGHSLQAKILRTQLNASEPLKKQLWRKIVQAKLQEQAKVLNLLGKSSQHLEQLSSRVRSGDPENIEGQAAKIYWKNLFGVEFIRDQTGTGKNVLLNYGYAVIRAAVARAIVSSGLNPAFPIHHSNQYNAIALTDDLIEPIRPRLDLHVFNLASRYDKEELTTEIKHSILEVLTQDSLIDEQVYSLLDGLGKYAASFKECLEKNDSSHLSIPKLCL